MNAEYIITTGLQVVAHIAADEDTFQNFMTMTGMDIESLRASIDSLETIAAVLDFLLENENILIDFCRDHQISAEEIWRLRNQLPGAPAATMQSA